MKDIESYYVLRRKVPLKQGRRTVYSYSTFGMAVATEEEAQEVKRKLILAEPRPEAEIWYERRFRGADRVPYLTEQEARESFADNEG